MSSLRRADPLFFRLKALLLLFILAVFGLLFSSCRTPYVPSLSLKGEGGSSSASTRLLTHLDNPFRDVQLVCYRVGGEQCTYLQFHALPLPSTASGLVPVEVRIGSEEFHAEWPLLAGGHRVAVVEPYASQLVDALEKRIPLFVRVGRYASVLKLSP